MEQIIAGVYQIEQKIGAGGGGIVYLATHLRLGKRVVLKADRRKLSAPPAVLRREVDALKDLSHTYIPQVYDFIAQGDTVYTVMDYIEGESLDKPLRRGERFSSAQVIEWGCELLEALCYLHSRPPHGILHGDIKPSNVMRTPQNEIRLIDFNIALALGEEGAVKVGYSRGYASPEHYGSTELTDTISDRTETMPVDGRTATLSDAPAASVPSSSGRKMLLDVRSDIYSLGATLYHLLTGRHPAADAAALVPIAPHEASPAVCAIIHKAMAPLPEDRYQSAAEMLDAFRGLHTNDPRTKRLRRARHITAAILLLLFAAGGSSAFVGLRRMEQLQTMYAYAADSERALRRGDIRQALTLALNALPQQTDLLTPAATASAQKALTDALGVYDLTDGFKEHGTIALESAPLKLALAPDGRNAAVLYDGTVAILDTQTTTIRNTLPAVPSALADVVFADAATLLYAGAEGLCAFDLTTDTVLWRGAPATSIALSADGSTIAAVYKDDPQAILYDRASGVVKTTLSFGERHLPVLPNDTFADPEDALLALNADGTLLAVSFADGAVQIIDVRDRTMDIELYDASDYTHFEGGFFGDYLAFSSTKTDGSVFAVIDTAALLQTGGFAMQNRIGVQTDEHGIYLTNEDLAVQIDPETGEQQEIAYINGSIRSYARGEEHVIVAADDDTCTIFDRAAHAIATYPSETACDFVCLAGGVAVLAGRDTPAVRILHLERHPEAQFATYDPSYPHDEARVSADGQTILLFRYDQFRVYGLDGSLICETAIPDAAEVYDQQFRRDGQQSYLEVLYNDGRIRTYAAADGALLSERQGEKPDRSLHETFETDTLRIEAPLHGAPIAYDRASGRQRFTLPSDAYLTYVTQVGDQLIAEYITADGARYGLLLNEQGETLAELPGLCDIVQDRLVFDDQAGDLRVSRIYTIDELKALGQTRIDPLQKGGIAPATQT